MSRSDPSRRGMSRRESLIDRSLEGISLRDPSLRGISLSDPSLNDPSLNDPSLNDPSLNDRSLIDPSLKDRSLNESLIDISLIESLIDRSLNESLIDPFLINSSLIPSSPSSLSHTSPSTTRNDCVCDDDDCDGNNDSCDETPIVSDPRGTSLSRTAACRRYSDSASNDAPPSGRSRGKSPESPLSGIAGSFASKRPLRNTRTSSNGILAGVSSARGFGATASSLACLKSATLVARCDWMISRNNRETSTFLECSTNG